MTIGLTAGRSLPIGPPRILIPPGTIRSDTQDEGRRRTREKTIVVIIAIAVVTASIGLVLYVFIRPWTLHDVLGKDRFTPGQEVVLEGTITGIARLNTSDGPAVYLELDREKLCSGADGVSWGVVGDPAASYRIGDRFRTTLHFAAYRFNGDPAVSAPELACPFPGVFHGISVVWDGVSSVVGFSLMFREKDGGGWSRYEIVTLQGDRYRASVLPVTLRRSPPLLASDPDLRQRGSINSAAAWTVIAGVQYVLVSGQFIAAPIVDSMTSLAAATSRNGTLRFVDSNGDGLVGDGDTIDVHLPDPGGATAYDTYMLQVGEVNGTFAEYVGAGHYILNGPRGPFEIIPSLPVAELVHLRHTGDQVGARVTSTAQVTRVRLGVPQEIANLSFELSVNGSVEVVHISDLPAVFGSGVSLSFADRNVTGQFDTGDEFVVGNLANRTGVQLRVFGASGFIATADWIAGFGHAVSGMAPRVTLTAQGSGPYRVSADVKFWHPELALNRTVRVSLRENSIPVMTDLRVVNGTVGTFANGTLAFTDADGDGTVSSGDFFMLQGGAGARYDLTVSIFFGGLFWNVVLGP